MAATAVIAGVVLLSTAVSADQAAQTRRQTGQKANGARQDQEVLNKKLKDQETQQADTAASRIQRQRQRALAGQSRPSLQGGGNALGNAGGAVPSTTGAPASGSPTVSTGGKTVLGS
jgi:hypothetical protein